jgi:RNA polymerase sigma factor for flagellar operon FliA
MPSTTPAAARGVIDVDELCRTHLVLVQHEVRALAVRLPRHVVHDDLVSAGMAALAQAAIAFDSTLGVPFGSFATRRIRGALLDELRSVDWASRSVRARVRARDTAQDTLTRTLGRAPTAAELATEMSLDVAELANLAVDVHRAVVLSVEGLAPRGGTVDDLLPAILDTPESALVERERQSYLHDAVQALPERLKVVVVGYFFEERTVKDLANELGVTESRISQLRTEAMGLLKDGMNAQLAPELVPSLDAGVVATARRDAYYAAVATRSSYHSRLSVRSPRTSSPSAQTG